MQNEEIKFNVSKFQQLGRSGEVFTQIIGAELLSDDWNSIFDSIQFSTLISMFKHSFGEFASSSLRPIYNSERPAYRQSGLWVSFELYVPSYISVMSSDRTEYHYKIKEDVYKIQNEICEFLKILKTHTTNGFEEFIKYTMKLLKSETPDPSFSPSYNEFLKEILEEIHLEAIRKSAETESEKLLVITLLNEI